MTETGLKIPVCPGLSNTQCLSDRGLHSGNPVDPCDTFMGVEAFSLDIQVCLRTHTHILPVFSSWRRCTRSTSYTIYIEACIFMLNVIKSTIIISSLNSFCSITTYLETFSFGERHIPTNFLTSIHFLHATTFSLLNILLTNYLSPSDTTS